MIKISLPYDYETLNEDEVYLVPMKDVFADSTFNCRGFISKIDIYELAREIRENGLLQPITIQPYDRVPGYSFRIVAGYRRFEAHVLNGETEIKALIRKDLSDLDARVINLVENTQRTDLRIDQEATAINHMLLAGWKIKDIASRVGKPWGWVKTRKSFLELPKAIQDEVVAGLIPQIEINAINDLTPFGWEAQMEYVKQVKDTKLLGKKKKPDPMKMAAKMAGTRLRTQEEIYSMQEAVQDSCHNNQDPIAAALGWAAGNVDDERLKQILTDYCRDKYDTHFLEPAYIVG